MDSPVKPESDDTTTTTEEVAPRQGPESSLENYESLVVLKPYVVFRWFATGVLLCLFSLRILTISRYYLITYALSIYLALLHSAYIRSRNYYFNIDSGSALESGTVASGPTRAVVMPRMNKSGKHLYRLPEFKFWKFGTSGIIVAFGCTTVEFMDIPVYIPVLAAYLLFVVAQDLYDWWRLGWWTPRIDEAAA